jgi:osmotically-inducible protein OsmY
LLSLLKAAEFARSRNFSRILRSFTRKEPPMKIKRTARNILSITAFAWSIPFAQAGDVLNRETESEPERASAVRVRQDAVITAKVLAALLVQPEAKSLDIFVDTRDGEVRLTGFVRDEVQRKKALEITSAVAGVAAVRDDLAKR